MHFSVLRFFTLFVSALLIASAAPTANEPINWASLITGSDLKLAVLPAEKDASSAQPPPVVFYLQNLAAPRIGTDSDEAIIADLRHSGHLVVLIDYSKNSRACVPFINRDLGKLRDDLRAGKLLPSKSFDASRVYIVPSGHRLKRDLVFFHDDVRTLALDLIYPSGSAENPARRTGTVLEFSCDNKDRFGNTSLSICSDTLLDGFATEGFAVAMADHPVAAPYKGLDAMPSSAWKIKAAVRTLRAETAALGLSGKIIPVGFSRGSGMALMLLSTEGLAEFEGHGEHPGVSSAVQGAVILSGRFTYTDLRADDHMIPRYDKAWGTRETALDTWRRHGALEYLGTATSPVFLSINITESPDALHQMTVLRKRLAELGSDDTFMMDREPRGHKVPLDPAILAAMNNYLKRQLAVQ
ncbi:hypothetical protein CMV30_10525 [Nibricoccus aquaticus]|uniref:Alpha/beta hydrolase n=1 Tax=Nibricoccus aquaticus TaxID=2576891 RepID=A0A290Q7G7_9BACT|nr:hypothetical protein [Nibricoccus aquaticus]ATC64353.1 hypothetical protein CMV30_10525 [Nibricoccus aquaticus]